MLATRAAATPSRGGDAVNNAGTFNASNTMNGAICHTAGVAIVSMNTGAASFVQQAVNVQANLNIR